MPDFFPQIQENPGIAEAIAQLIQQRGQAWGNAIQGLGQNVSQRIQDRRQQQNQTMTPAQAQGLSQLVNAPPKIGNEGQSFGGGINPNQRLNSGQTNFLQTLLMKKMQDEMLTNRQTSSIAARGNQAQSLEDLKAQHKQELAQWQSAHPKVTDQTLSKDEMDALKKATLREKDPLDPSIITFRGPRAKILAQSLMENPTYTPKTAKGEMAATTSGASAAARLEAAGPPQILARYANSTKEVLKVAEKASEDYPRFGAQFLNSPYNKLETQTSPEALQFKQVVADLRGHIAAVLAKGYAPQQEQIQEASRYIPDTITPKQLKEDLPFLNKLIDIQVKGMMTPVASGGNQSSSGKYDDVINKVMGGQNAGS